MMCRFVLKSMELSDTEGFFYYVAKGLYWDQVNGFHMRDKVT